MAPSDAGGQPTWLQLTVCRVDTRSGRIEPGSEVLSPREVALLAYLAARPGEDLARSRILCEAFGYSERVQSRAVDKAMLALRKRVERDPARPDHLLTNRGGYRFAPLPSRSEPPATRLVGRRAELDALRGALAAPGLVSVVGPGGVGKTTLAHEAARPAVVVPCAHVVGRAELFGAIGAALGVALERWENAEEWLGRALHARGDLVLVLDAFEWATPHAGVVAALLDAAPALRVLATSHLPLGIGGERVIRLAPLPDDDAVELLTLRAHERGHPVARSPALVRLARRLDGLPLALELAAAHLGVLGPDALCDRLAELGADSGLGGMLDRSWALTDEREREVLAGLTVFRSAFTADLAERVLGGPAVVSTLERLSRASLLQREEDRGQVRLWLLDVVRARAVAQGDPAQLHRAALAHARWLADAPRHEFLERFDDVAAAVRSSIHLGLHPLAVTLVCRLAEMAGHAMTPMPVVAELVSAVLASAPEADQGRAWLARALCLTWTGELDAAQQAVERAQASTRDDPAPALLLAARIRTLGGDHRGAEVQLESALPLVRGPRQHAEHDLLLADLCWARGDLRRTAVLAHRAFLAFLEAEEEVLAARARVVSAMARLGLGESEAAREALDAALVTFRAQGTAAEVFRAEGVRAGLAWDAGDLEEYLERSSALVSAARASGRTAWLAQWLSNQGHALHGVGRLEAARGALAEAVTLSSRAGLGTVHANALCHLGGVLASTGELDEAAATLERSCALFDTQGNRYLSIGALCALARIEHRRGHAGAATGALERARRLAIEHGVGPGSHVARELERTLTALTEE